MFTIVRPEFGSEARKLFIVIRALYCVKSSGAAFRAFLADYLYDIRYRLSIANLNA